MALTPPPPPKSWRPRTISTRGGLLRSQFQETDEAIFMTSGYVYGSAEEADHPDQHDVKPRRQRAEIDAARRCGRGAGIALPGRCPMLHRKATHSPTPIRISGVAFSSTSAIERLSETAPSTITLTTSAAWNPLSCNRRALTPSASSTAEIGARTANPTRLRRRRVGSRGGTDRDVAQKIPRPG